MHNLTEQLKDGLSQLSFDIPTIETSEDKLRAHRLVVDLLVIAGQLINQQKSNPKFTSQVHNSQELVVEEANKVKRRLPLWAKKPHQKNSQILITYLKLAAKSDSQVSAIDLAKAFDNPEVFKRNFPQMYNIADKNHGKVFEVTQDIVSIWPPVADAVEDFKKIALG